MRYCAHMKDLEKPKVLKYFFYLSECERSFESAHILK